MSTLQLADERMRAVQEDLYEESLEIKQGSSTSKRTGHQRKVDISDDDLVSLFSRLSCSHADEAVIIDSFLKSEQSSVASWQKQVDTLPKVACPLQISAKEEGLTYLGNPGMDSRLYRVSAHRETSSVGPCTTWGSNVSRSHSVCLQRHVPTHHVLRSYFNLVEQAEWRPS